MATTQTDAVAMTEQQLESVSGGPAFAKYDGIQAGVPRRNKTSPKMRFSYTDDDLVAFKRLGHVNRLDVILEDLHC